ncbi:MAG TPA: DUF6644 family protein [Vicinamibacterales bacterium]|nr:DUF6644 family protein [Vicinamibacterales bacterium]
MLQPYFQAMNDSWVAKAISESLWIYPLDQAIHLVFLALFAGAILILDIRLLGMGMREQSVSKVARDAWPWMLVGLLGLVATGIPQLIQNAMREYYSEFFWIKMYVLPVALIYTLTVRRMVSQAEEGRVNPGMQKIVGLVSILLWFGGVAIPSRLIGLFT